MPGIDWVNDIVSDDLENFVNESEGVSKHVLFVNGPRNPTFRSHNILN